MITPELVKEFWAFMQNEFGSSVEEKNDALVMQVAAELLNVLDIQDKEMFMKSFVTTLYKTIYIPFEVGVEGPDGRWSLWGQIRVCVHEHQHIVQGERDGWPEFVARYLGSSSYRAGYEAEAYGCDLEMEYWRTGTIIDVDRRSATLKEYGCTPEDIEMAKQMMIIRSEVVSHGVVESVASTKAIEWLEAHVDGLRELA